MQMALDIFLTILYAILGFSILVIIHEMGHMFVGIATGIHVEEFSIGFGPSPIKFRIKGILFRVSVIPFGGYCRFKGQEDFGTGQNDEDPDSFYGRPPWARLLTLLAGPFANILLAIIIFTIIFLFPTEKLAVNTIVVDPQYENDVELLTGDEILEINGKKMDYSEQIMSTLMAKFGEDLKIKVLRDGVEKEVNYTPKYENIESGKMEFIIGDTDHPVIAKVFEDKPAFISGLKEKDKILKINDQELLMSSQISQVINESEVESIKITVERDGKELDFICNPIQDGDRKIIGVYPVNIINPKYVEVNRSLGESFVSGLEESYNAVWTTLKGLGMLFSGRADVGKSVSGPIGIFTLIGRAGATQPFVDFLRLLGLISVLLGFFNLLPIPAVDGGHVVLTLIEMIRRKPLSMKIIQTVQVVGIVLILSLFVVFTIKDIITLPKTFNMFG